LTITLILSISCGKPVKKVKKEEKKCPIDTNIIVYTKKDGLIDNFISALKIEKIADKEILWIGTWSGLVKFDDARWITYTKKNDNIPQNHITDIEIDGKKRLWISTISLKKDGYIAFYDNISLKWKSIKKVRNAICLFNDSKNRLWVGTWGNGIFVLDKGNWKNYTKKDGIPSNEIMTITEFNGHIWFGSKNDGAFYLDEEKNQWVRKDEHSSKLINNSICSFASNENCLWIGTWGGVSKLDKTGLWESFTTWGDRLSDNFVRVIKLYKNKIFFGTDKGLTIYDGKKWIKLNKNNGLPSNKILSLEISKNYVWIGTDNGLVKIRNDF
jgi:ligand-binding sensor domain-containing protein